MEKELEEKGKFENRYKTRKGNIDKEKHPDVLREFVAEFGVCLQAIDKRFKAADITRKKRSPIPKKARKNGKNTERRSKYRRKTAYTLTKAVYRLFHAKHNLGAFFASQKTGLSGAPRFRAPAPSFGRKRPNAVAASHPSNPLRSCGVRHWRPRLVPKHPKGWA
jgi:hypothetical protein